MSAASDLIDFFKLNATYDPISASTREITQTSDRARRQRQVTIVKQWKRTKRLGHGAFGTVWLERDDEEKETRAVKEIAKGTNTTPLQVEYTRELLALGRLSKHPDVFVHFHGWFESDDSVYLAMEYFELGDLESYITPKLTEQDARVITRQLLEGLTILHEYNWAHRDLKPRNIFVVEHAPHWWVKIGDFGISKRIRGHQSVMHTVVGTPDYIAPEIMPFLFNDDEDSGDEEEESFQYSVAVDMWSLGCVLYRMLARQSPFATVRNLRAYCRSKKPFPTTPLEQNGVSQDGITVIQAMMRPYPADRLIATAALEHSWICIQDSTFEEGELSLTTSTVNSSSTQDKVGNFDEEVSIAALQIQPEVSTPHTTEEDLSDKVATSLGVSVISSDQKAPSLGPPSVMKTQDEEVTLIPLRDGRAAGQPSLGSTTEKASSRFDKPLTEPFPGLLAELSATAIVDHEANFWSHLSFRAGDKITVLYQSRDNPDWWYGRCDGKEGYFSPDDGVLFNAASSDLKKNPPKSEMNTSTASREQPTPNGHATSSPAKDSTHKPSQVLAKSSDSQSRYVYPAGFSYFCSDRSCPFAVDRFAGFPSPQSCEEHIRSFHGEEPLRDPLKARSAKLNSGVTRSSPKHTAVVALEAASRSLGQGRGKKSEHNLADTSLKSTAKRHVYPAGFAYYCSDQNCPFAVDKWPGFSTAEQCEAHIRSYHGEEPQSDPLKARTAKLNASSGRSKSPSSTDYESVDSTGLASQNKTPKSRRGGLSGFFEHRSSPIPRSALKASLTKSNPLPHSTIPVQARSQPFSS